MLFEVNFREWPLLTVLRHFRGTYAEFLDVELDLEIQYSGFFRSINSRLEDRLWEFLGGQDDVVCFTRSNNGAMIEHRDGRAIYVNNEVLGNFFENIMEEMGEDNVSTIFEDDDDPAPSDIFELEIPSNLEKTPPSA